MYSVIVRSGASDLLLFSLIISSIYEAQEQTLTKCVNVELDSFLFSNTYLATNLLNVGLCAADLHLFLGDIGRGLRDLLGELAVLCP